jgi:hypothetical protein
MNGPRILRQMSIFTESLGEMLRFNFVLHENSTCEILFKVEDITVYVYHFDNCREILTWTHKKRILY